MLHRTAASGTEPQSRAGTAHSAVQTLSDNILEEEPPREMGGSAELGVFNHSGSTRKEMQLLLWSGSREGFTPCSFCSVQDGCCALQPGQSRTDPAVVVPGLFAGGCGGQTEVRSALWGRRGVSKAWRQLHSEIDQSSTSIQKGKIVKSGFKIALSVTSHLCTLLMRLVLVLTGGWPQFHYSFVLLIQCFS